MTTHGRLTGQDTNRKMRRKYMVGFLDDKRR
jgi:hypothetical protein